jgi:nitrate/TMAO reductase-like tetraheme cytochrome c subunit
MSTAPRLFGLFALLATVVGLFTWIGGGGERPPSQGTEPVRRFESSAECRECHQAVWDEWHGSHHQISYLNPEVRALADDFRNKECQACHLPRPISETGYGQRVLPRQTHPEEGVSCLTCHQGVDGSILGRNDVPSAPCRPKASKEAISVEACASCHNQHQTTDQWRASHYAQQGVTCNDCHMPHVERTLADGRKRPGRAHRYPGAHDAEMLKKAGRLDVEVDGRDVLVAMTNVGAGHNFPTEERHRAVDLMLRFVQADGTTGDWQRVWRFRQPYRDEPGEDTQLPAGQQKQVRVPAPAGAVAAEVRMWYRLTPFVGDDDPKSTLLDERKVELR